MTTQKTLADLLREHIDRTGDSYSQIAKKTGLSKPLIGIIATRTEPRSYKPDTLRKLADGLRLPLDVVTEAAQVAAGLPAHEPLEPSDREDVRVIASLLPTLSDAELDVLRTAVVALAERHGR